MVLEEYLAAIKKFNFNTDKDQKTFGKMLGKAIKDIELSSDKYKQVCESAKQKGFKFVNIELT